jgi:hypothetical protein
MGDSVADSLGGVREPSFSLPEAREGGASSRRRGLIKPPRNLTLGGVFFTPPSLLIKEIALGVRGEEHLGQQQISSGADDPGFK